MANKITYNELGSTGIEVSNLCFGTLTVSPLQCNYSSQDAAKLFCYAIDKGINFFDTAQLYSTYEPLKRAIEYKNDIVISSKAYCYDKKTAEESIDEALRSIGRSYIDVFLLHEQESKHTIRGHWEAVEHILSRIEKGDIRTAGISTHHIAAIEAALCLKELQVIHPIYNEKGIGIIDGTKEQMRQAIDNSVSYGKGIYLMKALGGGHLIKNSLNALNHAKSIDGIASIAVGMKNEQEIDYNVSVFSGTVPNKELTDKINRTERHLHIHDWCIGCGSCVEVCQHEALKIVNNKVEVDSKKCILCGYCATRCKDFCIKVI